MSQHDLILDNAGGATIRADLNAAVAAISSNQKGPSAPPAPVSGMLWMDDNTPSSTVWTLKVYDGADWSEIGTLDTVSKVFTPAGLGDSGESLLMNGAGAVFQRGAGSYADGAYGVDGWYALTQSASITVAQQAVQENAQSTNIRITQPSASAQRIGQAQAIEATDCRHLRGTTATLAGRIRCSVSQTIRYAVLEWTGTANTITRDVVNDWTSGSYTTGAFFAASNLVVAAVGSITPAANVWTDLPGLPATFSAALNNVVVLLWTEGTLAQNATLDFGKMRLFSGSIDPGYAPRSIAQEMVACRRRYRTLGRGIWGWASAATGASFNYPLDPPMRSAPTASVLATGGFSIYRNSGNSSFPSPIALIDTTGDTSGLRISFSHGGSLTVDELWGSLETAVFALSAEL